MMTNEEIVRPFFSRRSGLMIRDYDRLCEVYRMHIHYTVVGLNAPCPDGWRELYLPKYLCSAVRKGVGVENALERARINTEINRSEFFQYLEAFPAVHERWQEILATWRRPKKGPAINPEIRAGFGRQAPRRRHYYGGLECTQD